MGFRDADELRTLARGMRRGDQRCAEQLWDAVAPRLFAVARHVLGAEEAGGEDIEDAVQRAFLSLLTSDGVAFRKIQDVQGWLVVTTRNEAKMLIRGASRRRERHMVHSEVRAGDAAQDVSMVLPHDRGDRVCRVERAMGMLEPELHEVVVLRQVGGLTFEGIAGVLGVSKSGAAQRYSKAIASLRKHLEAISDASKASGTSTEDGGVAHGTA